MPGEYNDLYVLNYLVNRQLGKKEKLIALFVDLKAVFDSINRKILTNMDEGKRDKGGNYGESGGIAAGN